MRPIPIVLAILFVAGCGTQPTAPRRVAPPVTPAFASPAPSAAPAAIERGEALLAGLRAAFKACTGVEAKIKAYSEGHYKAGSKVTELRKSTYVSKLLWVKPLKLRGDIMDTDNFLVGGASIVTTDGKRVTVKGAGLLGILPITLDVGNGLLASNRNYGFKQMAPDALMTRLTTPGATWQAIGTARVGSSAVELVEVRNAPALDKEVTRQVIGVDPLTFALRAVYFYAGSRKVADFTFASFRWDPKVKRDAFEL